MQKVFRITVDISKKIPAPAFEVNTNDLKSVKLEITITNGQSLLDLTDVTPRINIRKPDNEVIFQDCEIVDAKVGKVQIVLENQAYLVPGTHTAEIACYKGNEITAITGTFSYKSIKGIMNDEAVESKSEFTAIDKKIEEARKLIEDAEDKGVGVDEQARQKIEEVTKNLDVTSQQSLNLLAPTRKEKRAIFSFIADDARPTDVPELFPIVKDKNLPLGIGVITSNVGMGWDNLRMFANAGCEIMSHTHSHKTMPTLTEEEMHFEFRRSQEILRERGYIANGFVYPFNAQTATTSRICRQYYTHGFAKQGRSGPDGVNYPNISNYSIGRVALGSFFDTPNSDYVEQDTKSLAYYKERVDKAIANDGWLVFVIHSGEKDFDATQQQYVRDVIDYIRGQGYEIVSPSEGFRRAGNIIEIGEYSQSEHFIIDREGKEDSFDVGVKITNPNEIKMSTRITLIPNAQHRIIMTPITTNFAQSEGFPDGVAGVLKTYGFNTTYNYRYQEYEQLAGKRRIYRRYVNSSFDWQPWIDVTAIDVYSGYGKFSATDKITNEAIYIPGKVQYHTFSGADAQAGGFPEGMGGILKTFNVDTNYVIRYQEYQLGNGTNSSRKLYRRFVDSANNWTEWMTQGGSGGSGGGTLAFTKTIEAKTIPAQGSVLIDFNGLTGAKRENVFFVVPDAYPPSDLIWTVIHTYDGGCAIRLMNLKTTSFDVPQMTWRIKAVQS